MKLTLAEPKYFKDSITIISELVNEAKLKVTQDAIEMVAMDPANVAMVVFKLLSSAFAEYDVDKDTEICINLANLKQILRRCGQSDVLSLELDDDANKLKIQFKGNSVRTFSLPIIELDEKDQKVPDLTFPLTVKTPTEVLEEAVEDVDIVAESVSLGVEPKKFTIEADGDLSNAKIEIKTGDGTTIKTRSEDEVKAKYSIEYLKKIVRGGKLSEIAEMSFNKDYPLKVEFKEVDKVMLSFILAPRVENE